MFLALIMICGSASAQSHRFTSTYCFVGKEAGKKVHKTSTDLQVEFNYIDYSTIRVRIYTGSSNNALYDFTYQYESLDRGLYSYVCKNCGRGEISYLLSKVRPNSFASGDTGSFSIFIQDYMGAYEMSFDLKKLNLCKKNVCVSIDRNCLE